MQSDPPRTPSPPDTATAGRLVAASERPLPELARLVTRGFDGYFVRVVETAESLAWRLRYDSIDLSASLVAERQGKAAGLCLVAARGSVARIAAMGVVPEARRTGVGRQLLDGAIGLLRERGFARLRLEVVEQNEAAIELYRSGGMEPRGRLVGFERTACRTLPSKEALLDAQRLRPIDARQLATAVARQDLDLPWQLQPASLLAFGPPARVWELDGAMAAVTGVRSARGPAAAEEPVVASIQALFVPPDLRLEGRARRLVEALVARHPADRFTVAARVPEGLADGLAHATGFERGAVSQLEMFLDL